MITVRPSTERGRGDLDWLKTRFSFSFADYYDPRYMGFRALRVINEDRIQPGKGFGSHPHRDMEIVTYMVSGALEHEDSMGHRSIIRAGDVQRMSAGTGVVHSEWNPSAEETAHLLQIWIQPERSGLPPEYEESRVDVAARPGAWHRIAAPPGQGGAVAIHQNVQVLAAALRARNGLPYDLGPDRYAWIQVVRGAVELNGAPLAAGDGASVSAERRLAIAATDDAEILLFDLA